MTKKKYKPSLPYGAKKKLIWEWLQRDLDCSFEVIAEAIGCHTTYVGQVKRKYVSMLPKPDFGTAPLELTEVYTPTPEPTSSPTLALDVSDILDTRHRQHGTFEELSMTTTAIKGALRDSPNYSGGKLAPDQRESLDMIAYKMARVAHGDPHLVEHWDDIAGYATLVSDRLRGRSR